MKAFRLFPFLLLAITGTAHAVGIANDLPPPKPEEASGCDDTSGKSLEQLSDQACKFYQALDGQFGKNSWTTLESGKCRSFYNVAFRMRNLICNYKKADDETASKVAAAAAGVSSQTGAERNYFSAMDDAKKMHQKFGKLLSANRIWLAAAHTEYARNMKANDDLIPPASLRDEARCSGASGFGGNSGIQETHFIVPGLIRVQNDRVNKLFPKLREALNTAIDYSEAMEKGYGDPAKQAAARAAAFGSVTGASDPLNAGEQIEPNVRVQPAPEAHNEQSLGPAFSGAKEKTVDRLVVRNLEHVRLLGPSAGLIGAVTSLSIDVMIDKQPPDPRSVVIAAIGVASFGVGTSAGVLLTMVMDEEKRQAYYRSWATHEAPGNLNPVQNPKVHAKELSDAFCRHLDELKKQAEAEKLQAQQQTARNFSRNVQRQQAMTQDRDSILKAPSEQQPELIRQYRAKWGLPQR